MDELLGHWSTCARQPDIRLLVCSTVLVALGLRQSANICARFDASGNILEHYSDGDLVNHDTPFGREPQAPDSLAVWGPNLPLGFVTGRVEDAGKQLMDIQALQEPDALHGKAADVEARPVKA